MAVSPDGFQVSNTLFPLARRKINEIFQALTTLHFSTGDPPVMEPYMLQLTEINGRLTPRVRNANNSGWLYDVFSSGSIPSGMGAEFYGNTLPDGWLWQNGEKQRKADTPTLYDAIGDLYNIGDENPDEYRVPNCFDRVTVGAGGSYALGVTGGQADVAIEKRHLPDYNLNTDGTTHSHQVRTIDEANATSGGDFGLVFKTAANGSAQDRSNLVGANNLGLVVNLDGDGEKLPLMQPYLVCNKIIKI